MSSANSEPNWFRSHGLSTQPPAEKSQPAGTDRFSIKLLGWLGLAAFVVAVMTVQRRAGLANWLPVTAVMAGGAVLVGVAVSWVSFRLSGRSQTAATLTLVLALGAGVAGQRWWQPMAAEAIGPVVGDAYGSSPAARIAKALERQAAVTTGDEAQLHHITARLFNDVDQLNKRFNQGLSAFYQAGGASPVGLDAPKKIAQRIAMARDLDHCNDELINAYSTLPQVLLKRMREAKIEDNAIADYLTPFLAKYDGPALRGLRQADGRIIKAALQLLTILQEADGRWHYDRERDQVRFDLPAHAKAYSRWFEQMRAAADEQSSLQQKVLRGGNSHPLWFALSAERNDLTDTAKAAAP